MINKQMSKHTLKSILKRWRKTMIMNNVPWMQEDENAIMQLIMLIEDSEKKTVSSCEIHELCHNILQGFNIGIEDLIVIEKEFADWLEFKGWKVEEK